MRQTADRIEKRVVLRAPRDRVWHAISQAKQFGTWFGVELRLEEVAAGTQLTISESGFDRIPLERRAKAFTSNEAGWTHQSRLIAKYLDQPFS